MGKLGNHLRLASMGLTNHLRLRVRVAITGTMAVETYLKEQNPTEKETRNLQSDEREDMLWVRAAGKPKILRHGCPKPS